MRDLEWVQEGTLKKERKVPEFDQIDPVYENTFVGLCQVVAWVPVLSLIRVYEM